MIGTDTGKPERKPYEPPYFRRLDIEESSTGSFVGSREALIHEFESEFFNQAIPS
jgi:hypothetical protein